MNIKALEHIHRLLKEEVAEKLKLVQEYESIRKESYDRETDSYDAEIEEKYNWLRGEYLDALRALNDFEEKEW